MTSIPAAHPRQRRPARFPTAVRAAIAVALAAGVGLLAGNVVRTDRAPAPVATVAAAPYVAHELVVGYDASIASPLATIRRDTGIAITLANTASDTPHEIVVRLPAEMSVPTAAVRIGSASGVTYAVPDYIAHIAGAWIPDDPGRTHQPGGWRRLQWNFGAASGVNAPAAWENLRIAHRPGAKGVVIAVVDTGVAFKNWGKFKRSPDFRLTHFIDPCDLVAGKLVQGRCTSTSPLDREGHGTFVAGEIAEQTNNGIGLTGLAYGASIIPIRVLDSAGEGDSSTIAAGIRYAVQHGAQVINLSMEFSLSVSPNDIPDILSAINYAHEHNAVVVGAAGNDDASKIALPARARPVVAVGATTSDRCLADYSDGGSQLALVAPGGGDDASADSGPNCHPNRALPDVYQMTLANPSNPRAFSMPSGWYGTSMAAPAVSAAAAMVIASGVLGPRPTSDQILERLEQTATPLGNTIPSTRYGYGLLNIGAATSRTIPTTVTTPTISATTPVPTTTNATTPTATAPAAGHRP
jgi:serine protease